jgi:sn-glycerol 3-phosphate transport system permease protein
VNAAWNTLIFSTAVVVLAMSIALALAALADREIRGKGGFRTLLLWPYALAPAVAAVLWGFMFHPSIGVVAQFLDRFGVAWDHKLNGTQAMLLVILASAWKQVSYNFIFFLAGLQGIPRSVLEAASIDGASEPRRFWTIVLPLLAPTTFFLVAVNLVYAFFDTFGIIHALTRGGPGRATETLIYRVYLDGVVNLNLGSSAAQSVVLMALVIGLTAIQFAGMGRKRTD